MKRIVSSLLWVVGAAALLALFVAAGRWSSTPLRWGDVGGWLDAVPPEEAVIELARWAGIVVTCYVLAVATLVVLSDVADALRLAPLARAFRAVGSSCAFPALRRRLIHASTATALSVSTLSMTAAGAAVAAPTSVEQTVNETAASVALPEGLSVAAFAGFELPAASPTDATSLENAGEAVAVEAGDTLWDLTVARYGRCDPGMIGELARVNGIADPSLIFPGQMLVFPADLAGPVAPPPLLEEGAASWGVHRIVAGDTLWDILEGHYGRVDADLVWMVAGANGIEDPSDIPIGADVTLPPLGGDVPVEESASPVEPTSTLPPPATLDQQQPLPAPSLPVEADTSPLPPPPFPAQSAPAQEAAADEAVSATAASPAATGLPGGEGSSLLFPWGAAGGATAVAAGVEEWIRRRRRACWPVSAGVWRAAPTAEDEELPVGVDAAAGLTAVEWALTALRRLFADSSGLVPAMVEVDEATLSVRWVDPQPLVPAPWWSSDAGEAWHLSRSAWLPPRADDPPPDLAGLVAFGVRDGRRLLVNLTAFGSVEVDGPDTDGFVATLTAQLASGAAWSDALVEFVDVELPGSASSGRLSRVTGDGVVAGRPANVSLVVKVVESDHPAAAALVQAASDRSGWLAVVVLGSSDLPARLRVRLLSDGRGELPDLHVTFALTAATSIVDSADPPPGGPAPGGRSPVADGARWSALGERELVGAVGVLEAQPAPAEPAEPTVAGAAEWSRPRVMLRVFGEVGVDGAAVTQAVAVPFVVAAAGRPVGATEICELTGYAPKTLSTTYTTTHPVLDRVSGTLVLADGVWTEHGWIAECVRRAAATMLDGPSTDSVGWLRTAFADADAISGTPYERPPGNRRPWEWVDEFPVEVSTRAQAAQDLVEAVLLGVELWKVAGAETVHPAESLVELCCRLARLLPYAAVARSVRPSQWRSGGECLLLSGLDVAAGSGMQPLVDKVHTTARRLVVDSLIDPSDEFADALGL